MKWKKRKVKLFTQMFWNISLIIGICTVLAALFFMKIMDDLSTKYLGEEAMLRKMSKLSKLLIAITHLQ